MSTTKPWMCLPMMAMVLILSTPLASAWEESEFEVFDLVDEVQQNFYEYMEISPEATTTEIRKAYR